MVDSLVMCLWEYMVGRDVHQDMEAVSVYARHISAGVNVLEMMSVIEHE